MARGATIHKFRLSIANADDGVYEQVPVTLARHPSENEVRAVARLLAYALCWEPTLAFGRGVSTSDEPDLWSRSDDGRVRRWVEVGQPAVRRLVRASRRAERVVLFAFGGRGGRDPCERWWASARAELAPLANLDARRIDDALLRSLGEALGRSNDWSVTLADGHLFVDTGEGAPLQGRVLALG